MKMWVLIIVTLGFDPSVPHTHVARYVGNQYYADEKTCMQFYDAVLLGPHHYYLQQLECRPAPYQANLIGKGSHSLEQQTTENHLIYWR